jgi:hypothetical protein
MTAISGMKFGATVPAVRAWRSAPRQYRSRSLDRCRAVLGGSDC